ncbi:MAG: LLM class flavin-dependent oxidoreductase [Acidimicrobiia bacterium]|nr:LLM class flavin-dependent oxidoreductase [Acidimicrobiia bacterium]
MSYMMRFDLRAPSGGPKPAELYAAAVDMAEWAESNGGMTIALSEHHASPDGYLPSPLVMAAAMATRTTTMPMMIAASLFLFSDPVRLAEDIAVLDHLSNGRVSYVLGLGYRPEEFAMFGLDMGKRGALADTHIEVLLKALSGEPFEHDGRKIHVTPAPLTPGGPSIAYGGGTAAAARRAGRYGLDFFAQTNIPELEPAYRAAAEAAGHAPGALSLPDPAAPSTVFVADDLDAAWDELGPYLMHDVLMYAAWNPGDATTASLSRAKTADDLRAERASHQIFSVDEAVEHVRTAGFLPLHPLCGGLPPAIAWPYLKRVAEKVLPAVSA